MSSSAASAGGAHAGRGTELAASVRDAALSAGSRSAFLAAAAKLSVTDPTEPARSIDTVDEPPAAKLPSAQLTVWPV